jgi:hypothetical protein
LQKALIHLALLVTLGPVVEKAKTLSCKSTTSNIQRPRNNTAAEGIDPAWGSSAFGIVVTQFADGIVQILHADEYRRPD